LTPSTLLSTDAAPAHERVGYWGDLVQRSFGRLRSQTYGDERFRGEIRRFQLGELRLCRLDASRHRVERTSGSAGLSDPGDLKMVVQRKGCSLFEQDGRRTWLAPGSWSVYDTTKSYTVSNPQDVLQYVLLLPRARILNGAEGLREMLVRPLSGTRGMGRVACESIERALEGAGGSGHWLAPELGETILRQVRLALLEQSGALAPARARDALRERVTALVSQHLQDPGLDIDAIAGDLGCSKRALHKAFEDQGASLHRFLWLSRLELARSQLEDPSHAGRSITSILLGAGFTSAAHFSRTFRQHYGASPRDWRAHGSKISLHSVKE
jgi:AraC-like DNA-binding protein